MILRSTRSISLLRDRHNLLIASAAAVADRLSTPPDLMPHQVMSFLRAWEVARTCVLSRRCRRWEEGARRWDGEADCGRKNDLCLAGRGCLRVRERQGPPQGIRGRGSSAKVLKLVGGSWAGLRKKSSPLFPTIKSRSYALHWSLHSLHRRTGLHMIRSHCNIILHHFCSSLFS
jgi:hypothetical protein